MRSPARAIAWEFRRKLRFVPIALAGTLLVLGAIRLFILEPGQVLDRESSQSLAVLVVVPLSLTFMVFLAVFSFGLEGDLAGRPSIYPARMYTLPVTTRALVGWPMLYGSAAMMILLLITGLFVRWESSGELGYFALRPWGEGRPLIWPALLAAVFLAWTQALMWMPYGFTGLRVIVAVPWLAALDAAVFLAIEYQVPEPVMIAFLAPQLPLAYFAACFAVARARRGEVPDWRGIFARLGRITELRPRRRAPFASPARAQMWFEWRRQGLRLPAMMALLLPFELALLFIPSDDRPGLVFYTLLAVLLTPPAVAGFAAATANRPDGEGRDAPGVAPFDATRPLSSAALVAARLRVAMGSTLSAWLLVAITIPLALTGSDTWPVVIERTGRWIDAEGTLRAVALALMGLLGLLGLTWKGLVQNLGIGLTGREWVIKASLFFALSYLLVFGPLAGWILSLYAMAVATDTLPWIVAALIGLKISAFGWVATRLRRERQLSDRTLVTLAAAWLAVVLAVFGLLTWLVTTPFFPRFFLALGVVLAIPLARLSAAPLALRGIGITERSRTVFTWVKRVIRALLVLGLPAVSVALAGVSFYFLNRTDSTLFSSGETREYLLYVPQSYDRTKPTPLVISLHGGGGWPAYQRDTSRWNRLADSEGFLVAYPAGSGAPRAWSVDHGSGLPKDVRFISELIDTLEAAYTIDPTRIYADGLSNGAGMAFVLSCTLSDRIAAVGMVAAAHSLPWSWCADHKPVPMVSFHGTADALTPYHGGRSPAFPKPLVLPSIPTWTANWARRNQCETNPVESVVAADVTRLEYTGCADDASVVLYTVHGGGHTWPGGGPIPEWLAGKTSRDVDATSQMWAFFRAHRLPVKQSVVPQR